jgi:hypothetical protein
VRIDAASYALDGDPWGVVVHLECPGERCTGMRLHMAGMEWPGPGYNLTQPRRPIWRVIRRSW